MKRFSFLSFSTVICFLSALAVVSAEPKPGYIKKTNRLDSLLAMLKAAALPTLDGKRHYLRPFDNDGGPGFVAVYPQERENGMKNSNPTLAAEAGENVFKNSND